MAIPAFLNPATIQMVGSTVVYLIQTGKLVGTEIAGLVKALMHRHDPALSDEQLDVAAKAIEDRAEVREALSLAEAGGQA